mmetsp:Transcript_26603/g.66173  ORF Transcript_26603/g.66173 Transcript_26603/m.66173 type:complete len:220 (+) Transcript_26603:237-896(+)
MHHAPHTRGGADGAGNSTMMVLVALGEVQPVAAVDLAEQGRCPQHVAQVQTSSDVAPETRQQTTTFSEVSESGRVRVEDAVLLVFPPDTHKTCDLHRIINRHTITIGHMRPPFDEFLEAPERPPLRDVTHGRTQTHQHVVRRRIPTHTHPHTHQRRRRVAARSWRRQRPVAMAVLLMLVVVVVVGESAAVGCGSEGGVVCVGVGGRHVCRGPGGEVACS